MPIIEIIDVIKHYKEHTALNGINLSIDEKEIVGVIGMSGAGKTTLMRCLIGLEKPCSGQILFHGENLVTFKEKQLSAYRKKIGMVFQHFHLFPSRTVAENIAYPMEIRSIAARMVQERVTELLELVDLSCKKDVYPANLSGGEKQRIAIARALANRPEVLFCDEPTSALDACSIDSLLTLLQDLNTKLGLTIVVITHQLDIVKKICSNVILLSQGVVQDQKPTGEFFDGKEDLELLTHFREEL